MKTALDVISSVLENDIEVWESKSEGGISLIVFEVTFSQPSC